MTIEQKALELVNAANGVALTSMDFARGYLTALQWEGALHQAIEAHEADKHRFSEAAAKAVAVLERFDMGGLPSVGATISALNAFNIPQADPLVEALEEVTWQNTLAEAADELRAALEARGLAIVKKEAV